MLPLEEIDDALGRDEILDFGHKKEILAYCAEMGSKFNCANYQRFLFGHPIDTSLAQGYWLSIRALRETTPHACAQETAIFAGQLSARLGYACPSDPTTVLELCTGIGQSAYSYAQAGFRVKSVENHKITCDIAIHNIQCAGLVHQIECILADAPETLNEAAKENTHYSVVHMDPPWGGHYNYDLNKPFSVEYISLDVPGLIQQALRVADVVVLNMPHNLDNIEIQNLAQAFGCSAVIQYQHISRLPRCFGQAPVFFFQPPDDKALSAPIIQEVSAYLTLDGHRIHG